MLRKTLSLLEYWWIVMWNTFHLLGSEWRYVLISTVCSLPSKKIKREPVGGWLSQHVGFVGDPNQINVGITRAKEGLCIIGEMLQLIYFFSVYDQKLHLYVGKIHNLIVSVLSKETKSCSVAVHLGKVSLATTHVTMQWHKPTWFQYTVAYKWYNIMIEIAYFFTSLGFLQVVEL